MSALRQLLSALWAAIWLRGRLLALRLRRPFGGRPVPGAGPDFHLATAEVPVEDVDYEPFEPSAELAARLDAMRAELVGVARSAAAAQTRPKHVRRRRAIALVTAVVVGLAGLGAGASALVRGTTGVPAVDRLLGVYEQGLDKPGASSRSGPSGSDLQPSTSKASEPIKTTLPDGARIVTSFYVSKDGEICWAVVFLDGNGTGGVSCEAPRVLVEGLQDGGYAPAGGLGANYAILGGYVRSDVASLSGRAPMGSVDVRLGSLWAPSSAPPVGVLKPFVAVARHDSQPGAGTPNPPPPPRLQSYAFDGVTEDGRRIQFRPSP